MKINVLYSSDENYAQHAGVSLFSLLDNNEDIDEITVYMIENNLSSDSKEKFNEIIKKYNRQIIYIPIDFLCEDINKRDNYFLSSYARLFISKIKEIDKILYLDCDTVITQSVKSLWNIEIYNYLVAGVQDNPAMYNAEVIGMTEYDRYINAGVLLMNLKKWRESGTDKKVIEFIDKYNGCVPHHDQGIINGICKDNILIIDPVYNAMSQFFMHSSKQIKSLYDMKNYYSQEQLDNAVKNPVIVHYINKFFNRPWFENCSHPMKNLYINYLKQSPWSNVQLNTSKNDPKIRIRKWIFDHLPFSVFAAAERVLDIKRKRHIKDYYNH